MKKLIKLLLPTAAIISAAPICLTACHKIHAIPTDKLNLVADSEGKASLQGLKKPEEEITGCDTLLVPKNVVSVSDFVYTERNPAKTKAYECIKTIMFENDSICERFAVNAFQSLPNLETVIFPAKIAKYEFGSIYACPKLAVLDFSNLITLDPFKASTGLGFSKAAVKGKIIVKRDLENDAKLFREYNKDLFSEWEIELR